MKLVLFYVIFAITYLTAKKKRKKIHLIVRSAGIYGALNVDRIIKTIVVNNGLKEMKLMMKN